MFITGYIISNWQCTKLDDYYSFYNASAELVTPPSPYKVDFNTLALHSVLYKCQGVVAISIYRRCDNLLLTQEGHSWKQIDTPLGVIATCKYTCGTCENFLYCSKHERPLVNKRVVLSRQMLDGGFGHQCHRDEYLVFISSYTEDGAINFLSGEHLTYRRLSWRTREKTSVRSSPRNANVFSGLSSGYPRFTGKDEYDPFLEFCGFKDGTWDEFTNVFTPTYESGFDYNGVGQDWFNLDDIVVNIPEGPWLQGVVPVGIEEIYDDDILFGPDLDFVATVHCRDEPGQQGGVATKRNHEILRDHIRCSVELARRHKAIKRFTIVEGTLE